MSCENCHHRLSGQSLFSCLSSPALQSLDQYRITRKHLAGQTIFQEGDECYGIYCLKSGLVTLEASALDGGVQLLRWAKPGEPLGYRAYLTGQSHKYRATALTPVTVCALPADTLRRLTREDPALAEAIIQKLAKDLETSESRWLGLRQKTSTQRVATLLLELAQASENWPSRKEMARMVDMTAETLTRILSKFHESGWIRKDRRSLSVLKPQELESHSATA